MKFNLGGTVVQVPTEILLKHEGSKIAAITGSAMHVGDMAIPLPRHYEMFCHCVFYVCNEKVQLPPSVHRKDFMKEMKYYGIPFDETLVSGGKCASPNTSTSKLHSSTSIPHQKQISPTTVTQLHYHAADAPAPGPHQPGLISKNDQVMKDDQSRIETSNKIPQSTTRISKIEHSSSPLSTRASSQLSSLLQRTQQRCLRPSRHDCDKTIPTTATSKTATTATARPTTARFQDCN